MRFLGDSCLSTKSLQLVSSFFQAGMLIPGWRFVIGAQADEAGPERVGVLRLRIRSEIVRPPTLGGGGLVAWSSSRILGLVPELPTSVRLVTCNV